MAEVFIRTTVRHAAAPLQAFRRTPRSRTPKTPCDRVGAPTSTFPFGGFLNLPRVTAYLDYTAFLKDWFEAKKQTEPRYSYSRFAEAAGCARATLANVLSGNRRPRPQTLDAFARALELSPTERNYLGLLVELDAAPDLTTRSAVMDRILASQRYEQVDEVDERSDADIARFLGHWWVPVVLELAHHPDFRPDPDWLIAMIRPEITAEQAQTALDTLFDLALLKRSADGRIRPGAIRFRTAPDQVKQRAVLDYHRQVLPDLVRRMSEIPEGERHVAAALVQLDTQAVPEVKQRIATLVDQIATQADAASDNATPALFQVMFQLLPVSRTWGGSLQHSGLGGRVDPDRDG